MSFLDRFKTQPKYRNPDPAIRLAGVAELPDDAEHWGVIAELAASDEDVRVRRAAIERISVVGYLARIARTEKDETLRRELAERLVAIANAPADNDGDAAAALDGLSDQKHFGAIARSSPHDAVRTAALGKIHDGKVLASVARNTIDAQVALEAVARVTDQAELAAVATKTDHRDAGISALERAAEAASEIERRELLDGIAARAKNKSVAKRAKALVQEMDEAEAARKAAHEDWLKRVSLVLARLDAIAAAPGTADADAELDGITGQWQGLADKADQTQVEQFDTRLAGARAAIEARRREEAERLAVAERATARRAAFVAICERVEALRGENTPDEIEKARAEWEGMPGASAQEREDAELRGQFNESCRRAAERHENRQALERVHTRLGELSLEADRLATPDDNAPETPEREAAWRAVVAEWQSLAGQADGLDEAIAARFAEAEARVRHREEEKRAAAERTLKQQVQRIEQLLDRVATRAAAEDLTLREADRAVRDLKTAIEAPLAIPAREQHALIERLKTAMTAMAPRLHDLREMDEWKRFANAAVQEELIAKTEALAAKSGFDKPDEIKPEDLEKVAHELHEIQERWKQAAEAPRAQAQALWHRYRQAADPVQAKVREFFAMRAEERKANLERKLALIERAEQLADSTDWIKTAEELKKLQVEWQQLGPVPRQEMRATWKRFRDACDRFFTRRNADLAQRKETWADNLAKKEALCARAEALATSTEWERGAAEVRQLQAEWKTVGPVRRNKSEAIWQRFREACDTFFDRYKRRDQIELESKQADREALVTELESLVPEEEAAGATEPASVLERVRTLRSRWNQSTPVVRQGADPLSARFVGALERLLASSPEAFRGTDLDVDANRQKMEKLCARVEGFLTEGAAAAPTSSQALANMLREALAANTIGGRAGEESKWKAMADDVRQAQASWNRLGPVPGETGSQLAERFHRACSRFFELYRRRVPPQPHAQRGKPVGAR
jgi:Domain of Unknown Function (DUF349)